MNDPRRDARLAGALWLVAIAAGVVSVRLASRGRRDLDTGSQPITDAAELAQVRSQARAVHLKSLVVAVVLTGIAILI